VFEVDCPYFSGTRVTDQLSRERNIAMHGPGLWGIIIVAVVVVLLFGRGKISGMMGEMAQGIKAFQKGLRDDGSSSSTTTAQVQAPNPTVAETEKAKDA
jgi:sec-independent protein translocase protein TatA